MILEKCFLVLTELKDEVVLRMAICGTRTKKINVQTTWKLIQDITTEYLK